MYSGMAENDPKATVRRQIDENLRRIYDETLNEKIPDRLTLLLEQLRKSAAQEEAKDDDGGQT
jgi:Anti-sigma factor NepR